MGIAVAVDELVSVMVTVVTTSVFWDVVLCDGACAALVEPLSELVVMGTVGGSRTWPPGIWEDGPPPPSALVATTRVPAAASTTRVSTDTTDSF